MGPGVLDPSAGLFAPAADAETGMLRPTILSLGFAFAFALGGCATTMPLGLPPASDEPAIRYVNAQGPLHSSRVRTRSAAFTARGLTMTTRELHVVGTELTPRAIPLEEVRSIQFRHRGRGSLEGILVGLGGAAAVGLLAAVGEESFIFPSSRGERFALATGLVAVVTVPAGALLGALVGHRTTVEIRPARPGS